MRNTTYSLSERQCAAATTNWGWRPPYGIDLSQIAILGGSVSCNRNTGDRSDADTVNGNVGSPTRRAAQQGWTRDLEDILRVCSGRDEVNVVNLCMPAVGTEYFLGRLKVDDAVQRATVVLVETAVNDDDNERTEAATEAMVRALLALPRRPFLLWVAASLTRELETVAELRHLRVVREYGVGQVSVPNALRPSHDAAVQAFIRDVYLQDHVHPSRIGHRMVASVTAAHILRQQQPETVRAQLPSASPGAVRLRARVTGSEELSRRAEQPPRYMVNLADQRRCAHDGGAGRPAKPFQSAHGFTFREDVPGKCGLIATRPSSRVSFSLPANITSVVVGYMCAASLQIATALGGRPSIAHILARARRRSSYAHNGRASITLIQGRSCNTASGGPAEVSAQLIDGIDTLTNASERRVSVYAERYITPKQNWGRATDCSWLEVRVLKSEDRDEHKVKLLQIVRWLTDVWDILALVASRKFESEQNPPNVPL